MVLFFLLATNRRLSLAVTPDAAYALFERVAATVLHREFALKIQPKRQGSNVNISAILALGLGLVAVVGLVSYLFSLSDKDDKDESELADRQTQTHRQRH